MTDEILPQLAILWTIIFLTPPIIFGLVVLVKFVCDLSIAIFKGDEND